MDDCPVVPLARDENIKTEVKNEEWLITYWKFEGPNLGPLISWQRNIATSTVIFLNMDPEIANLLFYFHGLVYKALLWEGFPWCYLISSAQGETHSNIKIPCSF